MNSEGKRIQWMVWGLVAVAFVVGVGTIGVIGWTLSNIRGERAALVEEEQRLEEASEEISRLVLAFMRGLFPSSRPLDGTRGGGAKGGTRRFLDPADRMSAWEARQWSQTYAPWSREMGEQWLSCRRGRLNRLGLVWAVVLDNIGPRQLEQTHGMRHGSARKVLAEALWRYAEISGIYRGRRVPQTKEAAAE
jgi:hypothetical protein